MTDEGSATLATTPTWSRLTGAKRQATRDKRLATAVEWLAEGKPRNWKYMKDWR